MDYSHIPDRELDIMIAQIFFERRVVDVPFIPSQIRSDDVLTDQAMAEYRKCYPHGMAREGVKHYSTDYELVILVRNWIGNHGWQEYFIEELNRLMPMINDFVIQPTPRDIWAAMNVGPRLQCIAALMTVDRMKACIEYGGR